MLMNVGAAAAAAAAEGDHWLKALALLATKLLLLDTVAPGRPQPQIINH